MISNLVAQAIIGRLQADSTLYADGAWLSPLAGGAFHVEAPASNPASPYIVIVVDPNASDAAFQMESAKYEATLEIYCNRGTTGAEAIRALQHRVFGNAIKNSGDPAYGLHRFTPTLTVDATDNPLGWLHSSACMWVRNTPILPAEGNPDVLMSSMTFSGECVANP